MSTATETLQLDLPTATARADTSFLFPWLTAGRLQRLGLGVLRYGLVLILFVYGAMKWTSAEAMGIQPYIANSPLMSWLYKVTSVQGASIVIGVAELVFGALIAVRRLSPRLSMYGSLGTIFMTLSTLSFLVTTPGLDATGKGFLHKDVFLLGAAILTAGEALAATRPR